MRKGYAPLMGRITVKGKTNSVAQFACKFKVNPNLWNATSQRCTGKSKVAVYTNREIEKMLLLLRQRYNELLDMKADITAEEIKKHISKESLRHKPPCWDYSGSTMRNMPCVWA